MKLANFKKIYLFIFFYSIVIGAYLENIPVNLNQPDNSIISCLASGDEFYIRLHNSNNYTIIQNPIDGYYYYANFALIECLNLASILVFHLLEYQNIFQI